MGQSNDNSRGMTVEAIQKRLDDYLAAHSRLTHTPEYAYKHALEDIMFLLIQVKAHEPIMALAMKRLELWENIARQQREIVQEYQKPKAVIIRPLAQMYALAGRPEGAFSCGCIPSTMSKDKPGLLGWHYVLCPKHDAEMREAESKAGM